MGSRSIYNYFNSDQIVISIRLSQSYIRKKKNKYPAMTVYTYIFYEVHVNILKVFLPYY